MSAAKSKKKPVPATLPLWPVTTDSFAAWNAGQGAETQAWLAAQGFTGKPGTFCSLPNPAGGIGGVVAGLSVPVSHWDFGDFGHRLPAGQYHIAGELAADALARLALGWQLGSHRFTRYKKAEEARAQLVPPNGMDTIATTTAAIGMARDLITTPAEDMMPPDLGEAAERMAQPFGATVTHVVGEMLLSENYPAIHRVGRASAHAPRLIDLRWGEATHPRVTLVGKGVCFDSGGLDIKPSSGMYLMKKDMGGAACVLALARMIMQANLPVRLRVLIPAVENAIAGNAFRPADVITMRSGLTVEVGNTDAEGRLVLADALAEACSEQPDLLIDMATLTGAARGALGTDLPALFCNDDATAAQMLDTGLAEEDPMWRLPLHAAYARMLESPVADVNSAPSSPYAGAITAALFLQKFVTPGTVWAHIDLMAYNLSSRPGRPEGGEAMAVRGLFRMIAARFA